MQFTSVSKTALFPKHELLMIIVHHIYSIFIVKHIIYILPPGEYANKAMAIFARNAAARWQKKRKVIPFKYAHETTLLIVLKTNLAHSFMFTFNFMCQLSIQNFP